MGVGAEERPEQEQLQAEMKLLNWHKLANDAALKAALLKTKQMKERDARPRGAETTRAQAAWMQRVIEEEQSKPLQVSKDFVLSYQERERREEERLDAEVQRHIECLRRLRDQIEKRESVKAKKEAYRRAMQHQKQSVPSSKLAAKRPAPSDDGGHQGPGVAMTDAAQGTLTTVISSLDRLVDLERRIASLEKDSIFDRVELAAGGSMAGSVATDRSSRRGGGRSGLSFTKQRIPPSTTRPSKDVYAVRLQQQGPGGRGRGRAGPGGVRRPVGYQQGSADPNASRQDAAINSWLNRKKQREQQRQQQSLARANGERLPVKAPARGAASGRRGKNPAQQKFFDMKRQVEKRKDNMRRGGGGVRRSLGGGPPGGATYKATGKRRIRTTAGGGAPRGGGRMPKLAKSKTGGYGSSYAGSTRPGGRSQKPGARTLPHIAGAGVKGARGVRQAW